MEQEANTLICAKGAGEIFPVTEKRSQNPGFQLSGGGRRGGGPGGSPPPHHAGMKSKALGGEGMA